MDTGTRSERVIGEALSPLESRLLDLLCGGDDPASAAARAQRATVTWGGYQHDDCQCFLLCTDPSGELPPIEHEGGPFALAEVSDGTDALGLLELWVVDGLLHSVDYAPFGDGHDAMPSPDRVEPACPRS